jgi:hypothetical protein
VPQLGQAAIRKRRADCAPPLIADVSPMVKRCATLLVVLPMIHACGTPQDRHIVVAHISPDSQCSFKGLPVACDKLGAAIVRDYPDIDLEVQLCTHRRARYEIVSAALESLQTASISRIGFPDVDSSNGKSCRTGEYSK